MLVKYYDTDWTTYMENELLFSGSKKQCIKYLLRHWSVDASEYKDDPENMALFCDYLRHIYVANVDIPGTVEEIMFSTNWDNQDWHKINPSAFIFNRELLALID